MKQTSQKSAWCKICYTSVLKTSFVDLMTLEERRPSVDLLDLWCFLSVAKMRQNEMMIATGRKIDSDVDEDTATEKCKLCEI